MVPGDWRTRAEEAPKLPASEALRAVGIPVPPGVTLTVFIDSTERDGASLVLVLRPIPHETVNLAKGTLLALWGQLAHAIPYLAPWLGGRR